MSVQWLTLHTNYLAAFKGTMALWYKKKKKFFNLFVPVFKVLHLLPDDSSWKTDQDEMSLSVCYGLFWRQQELYSSSSEGRGQQTFIWAVVIALWSAFLSAAVQLANQMQTRYFWMLWMRWKDTSSFSESCCLLRNLGKYRLWAFLTALQLCQNLWQHVGGGIRYSGNFPYLMNLKLRLPRGVNAS